MSGFSQGEQGKLYSLPRAAVINCYNLRGLKQQKFILLVLEVRSLKSMYQQGHPPLKTRGESFFASLAASVCCWQPLILFFM
jgi:hypothetical protein